MWFYLPKAFERGSLYFGCHFTSNNNGYIVRPNSCSTTQIHLTIDYFNNTATANPLTNVYALTIGV